MLALPTVNDHVLKLVGVLPRMGGIRIDYSKINSSGQKLNETPLTQMLTLSTVNELA